MTENNNNINQYKFVPTAPKTETRIILEVKEPSRLVKAITYLGFSQIHCCNGTPCTCVSGSSSKSGSVVKSSTASIASAVTQAMSKEASRTGGNVQARVSNKTGDVHISYNPPKRN